MHDDDGNIIETPVSLDEMGISFNATQLTPQGDGVAMAVLGSDAQLNVRFFEKRVAIPFKSVDGILHFEAQDWVEIGRPNSKSMVVRKARDNDKRRFAAYYARYKQGKSQQIGTKIEVLAQVGLLNYAQIEMLLTAKLAVVEQLAAASEGVIMGLGHDGPLMQKYARSFLNSQASTQGKADVDRLTKEMQAQRLELQQQKDEMAARMAEIKAMQEMLSHQLQSASAQQEYEPEAIKEAPKKATKKNGLVTDDLEIL